MSQMKRWQEMAGILVERTDRSSATTAGGGGTGQVLKGRAGDSWEYKAEDDVWHTRRKGSDGEWRSLENNHKASFTLDRDNPGERSPAAIRATADALNKDPDDLGWIPSEAPPEPESGGEWSDVVEAPKMDLPMDTDHDVEIAGVEASLQDHGRENYEERDDWWDQNRQYYLTISDLLKDLSVGLQDDADRFPEYSQADFRSFFGPGGLENDSDLDGYWNIDDLGKALDYFRTKHTKKRARAEGRPYEEEDANAINYYVRSLASQEARSSIQNESLYRGRKENKMRKKSERLDIKILREAIRAELLREEGDPAPTPGMDPMKMMMMMQMAMPLVQQGISSLKGAFKEDPEAESRLSQLMQQNPRIADAAAIYGALEGLGTDEEVVRAMVQKNINDLPGLSKDFTTAVAAITNGEETGELVSMLKSDGMDEEADQIMAAITNPSAQTSSQNQQQNMPPAAAAGLPPEQMGSPQAPQMGQPMPMAEVRIRKLIRQELLKII